MPLDGIQHRGICIRCCPLPVAIAATYLRSGLGGITALCVGVSLQRRPARLPRLITRLHMCLNAVEVSLREDTARVIERPLGFNAQCIDSEQQNEKEKTFGLHV